MSTHPQDLELASRIASGCQEAAEEFEREFRPLITSIARRGGVPAADCEDVAQDVLLDAFRQLQHRQYRGDCALKTWVGRLARGGVADYWRKQPVSGKMLVPLSAEDDDGRTLDGQVTQSDDPPVVLPDLEAVVIVHHALAAMPAQHRFILIFNRAAGYTIEEISYALGLTPGQVARRLYQAEEMFRRMIVSGEISAGGQSKNAGGQSNGKGLETGPVRARQRAPDPARRWRALTRAGWTVVA